MKVLITGGAGFIGSHLCERLLADGHAVVCVDNLITGATNNVASLSRKPGFRFLRHDISKPLEQTQLFDHVLHFASPASPPDYLKYPIQTMKVGSLGTLNALERKRFIRRAPNKHRGIKLVKQPAGTPPQADASPALQEAA